MPLPVEVANAVAPSATPTIAAPFGAAPTQATGTVTPTSAPAIEVYAVIEGRTVPLPAWLRYVPEQQMFVATAVPDGGLPITIEIVVAAQRTLMVISERAN